jgi:hypothetical protein
MARKVALVLHPDYRDRLRDLAFRLPVWIVDTPENRAAVEDLAHFALEWPHVSMTLVRASTAPAAEEWSSLVSQLELQQGRALEIIEVIGASLSAAARAAFESAGFRGITETSESFRAKRTSGER